MTVAEFRDLEKAGLLRQMDSPCTWCPRRMAHGGWSCGNDHHYNMEIMLDMYPLSNMLDMSTKPPQLYIFSNIDLVKGLL
jgi:hypothetical protein